MSDIHNTMSRSGSNLAISIVFVLQNMLQFVEHHVKQTAADPGHDPLVRMRAYAVLDKLRDALRGNDLQDVLKRHPESAIFRINVILRGFELKTVDAFYDRHSTTTEFIEQLAWTLGFEDASNLALFDQRKYECLKIQDRVLLCNFMLYNHHQNPCHEIQIVLDERFSRVPDESSSKDFDVTYMYSLKNFTRGIFPRRHLSTVQLCVFEIFERHSTEPADHHKIIEAVEKTIPQRVI